MASSPLLAIDPSFDSGDVLIFAMDELGHTRAELTHILGSRSRAFGNPRPPPRADVAMIHDVTRASKLPADLLVRPYRAKTAA
jgi:HTH-type transcriptional regulator/antitoxin HigA